MASFSMDIDNKFGLNTYQDTKNTYEWIVRAVEKSGYQNVKIESEFSFYISKMFCSCESINEFVENAYGQSDYNPISIRCSICSQNTHLVSISGRADEISVYAGSKKVLEEIVNLLQETSLDENELNDPISVMYIERQDNSVIVNGRNNVVANNHSSAANSSGNPDSQLKQWLKAVGQNLLANGIWYLLCLGIGAIAAILLTKN